MNHHLTQFARQLSLWTEEIIEHGRTPFRRVDIAPRIETELGTISPPLIFWINRQSMMTGGLVFLPDNNLAEELERGRACASALGLRHFVTWETEQVRIWQISATGITEQHSFPLDDPDDLESFRDLLVELLDTLKLLAVLGAIPPAELPHWYFVNLFQITLQQALPPLVDAYRSQRSEMSEHTTEDADNCANEASRLLLLQILSLLWFDKLPDAILPEKMERAIELSLPELAEELRQPLSLKTTIRPPALPLETAVTFHHLLLRLQQLTWHRSSTRSQQSIFSLQLLWYPDGDNSTVPAPLQLHPAMAISDNTTEMILSASPSLLALSAFLTAITDQSPKKLFFGTLFQLDRETLPNRDIAARLVNRHGIASNNRRELTARLRSAWPNRHLKIKTGQPYWSWELTHLLGICHIDQKITLDLPLEILNEPKNLTVWTLLYSKISLTEIEQIDPSVLRLSGHFNEQPPDQIVLKGEAGHKEIHPLEDPARMREQILLALNLPDPIYKLLGLELIWPNEELQDQNRAGREFYHTTALYRWFQAILDNDTIPEPEPLLLKELKRFTTSDNPDAVLANLLDCPAVADIVLPEDSVGTKTASSETATNKKLRASLQQQLETHGIPNFPEQYLYFLTEPAIKHYSITPPLTVKNSCLGQFEIEDAQGKTITGYGAELEQTLLLCSEAGKTEFDLPEDRHQLEQLLSHYRKDLLALHKYLSVLCYGQVENSKTARQMIKTTWKKLSLPDPTWFKK